MDIVFRILSHNIAILFIALLLLAIIALFIYRFIIPAIRIQIALKATIKRLQQMKSGSDNFITDLEIISNEVMVDDKLKHLWNEYCETLHDQKVIDSSGQERVLRWRSTTMSEMFFTEQALVDIPLKTEFYKHLPGILTGLGIIGTFAGLIFGLIRFEVSGDADIVRTSLNELIKSVGYSFIVSATAISLAMLFTWIEKSLVVMCYRQVETLCQLIDSLFDAGAGEEYLARLVSASETSATQAIQIKDSLVADLKQILNELITQQLEVSSQQNKQLSSNISQSLSDSIRDPMERISHAVDRVGSNQGEAVNRLLTDVLSNFTAQMNDMFGSQLKDMSGLLQQTSMTMQTTASQFNQLAENIHDAGKGAADVMADRMNSAVNSLEVRQQIMNEHMGEFVEQIRTFVNESQSETAKKMQTVLEELGMKVSGMITQLESHSKQTAEEYRQHHGQLEKHTTSTIGEMSGQLQSLASEMHQASEVMQKSISSLSQSTNETINKFNSGADTLYIAASDFAKAGQGVSKTLETATKTSEMLQGAAQTLNKAINGVQHVIEENNRTREVFAAMVSDLKSTIENARLEASMTSDILSRIQKATDQLSHAQVKADQYLHSVTDVLSEAHTAFADSVQRTLKQGNTQFHKELSDAVSYLKSAIQDLGDTLDSVTEKSA